MKRNDVNRKRLEAPASSKPVESLPTSDEIVLASGAPRLEIQAKHTEVLPPTDRIAVIQSHLKRAARGAAVISGTVSRSRFGTDVKPVLDGIGRRSQQEPKITWRTLTARDQRAGNTDKAATSIPENFHHKVENETDILNTYWGWVGIIEPEYDLLEGFTLLDVDSYFRQSITRKMSLAFRNGVEVVGDNQDFVRYIERRTGQIGYMTGVTFTGLLKDILFNLYVCSNCVVLKIRDRAASGGYANDKNKKREPVAGYKICPPQTIFPYMDGQGRIQKWRRFFGAGRPFRDYDVADVIHFKWDVKPGHLFGTPRTTCLRDDIFALRRLEENIELLLVNHLFPLFHVKVGTPEAPSQITADGISEIDMIKSLIQNCPKEGVLVTDERVSVDVHGASKQGVDAQPMLEHYKQRIFTGLGVSGIDLGETDTGNRATAENVSQNLKDSVKSDLDSFCDLVVMSIFRELFEEAPSQLSVQNAVSDVRLEFHEIDVDTQIKKETHAANMYNNHGLGQTEYRKRMKMKPIESGQKKDMHFEQHTVGLENIKHRHQLEAAEVQNEHSLQQAAVSAALKPAPAAGKKKKAAGKKKSAGTSQKAAETVATIMQPTNQHGKNLDPHKARSAQDPELVERFLDAFLDLGAALEAMGRFTDGVWNLEAWSLICNMLPGEDALILDARQHLFSFVKSTHDACQSPDLLLPALRAWSLNPIPGEIDTDFSEIIEPAA